METKLYVYTGTGNSLWVARQLAVELKEATLEFMPHLSKERIEEAHRIGLIFPVHIWGLPSHVIQFINRLQVKPGTSFFALAVNAGQLAGTLLQLQRWMSTHNQLLSVGSSIVMPSNYTPWGGPGPTETQQQRYREAQKKMKAIAGPILRGEQVKVDRGALWQNVLFSGIYKMTFGQVHKWDKNFWVDDQCNSCQICTKICPVGNIEMKCEKPIWLHQCEQCFACLQWCPQKSIQHGKKTAKYPRYHHPEVDLKDMLEQAKANKA
jgi:ferredoxin